MTYTLSEVIAAATVIPVLTVRSLDQAAPLARALAGGGLRVIELTLRTPVAVDAMKAMQEAVPDLIIGLGTVTRPEQALASVRAGAAFLVSPGLTPALGAAMLETGAPCLPGVATAGEAMGAVEQGFEVLKFFPAEPAGGLSCLKALAGPLPNVRFCPTGGISRDRAADYLALKNVVCVGGSWIAPTADIEAENWDVIMQNSRCAARLG